MTVDLAPEAAVLVKLLDGLDVVIDLVAGAGVIPDVAIVQPWADQLRAAADKLEAASLAKNPAAVEVAAADAAASAAEDVKFGLPGQGGGK